MDLRLDHIELFYYKIPYLLPITTGNYFYWREGLILFLYDKDGAFGIGEVAPLEGISKETLRDCISQINELSESLPKLTQAGLKRYYPSVRFGLESAILSIQAKKEKRNIAELLSKTRKEKIKISALITEKNLYETEELISLGYSSFKIKVSSPDQWKIVSLVRDIVGEDAEIRIDANAILSFKDAISFAKKIIQFKPSYIEDPTKELEKIKDFFFKTNLFIGIDKHLEKVSLRYGPHIKAWIIKPGIVGGLTESLLLIKEAEERGIYPVLSNPFYSGIGTSMLIIMASSILDDIAMGFDPYRWIKEDLLQQPLSIKRGSFLIKDIENKMDKINISSLIRVK